MNQLYLNCTPRSFGCIHNFIYFLSLAITLAAHIVVELVCIEYPKCRANISYVLTGKPYGKINKRNFILFAEKAKHFKLSFQTIDDRMTKEEKRKEAE